jgi:hypothetical protein
MERSRRKNPTPEPPLASMVEPAEGVNGEPDDSVAVRAYRRFEDRGREHGRDLDDWLEAERELANKRPV